MKNSLAIIQNYKEYANKAVKSFPLYAVSFFIPFLVLFATKLLYKFGIGSQITGLLSMSLIFINGLAGGGFFFYIRHTNAIPKSSLLWQLALSAAYGLCSYGIVQENSTSTLYFYAIFPVIFLSFELMVKGTHHLPFLLLGTLALVIDPECAIPIFLLLTILVIMELKLSNKCSFGNLCHKLSCIFLTFLMASFRIVPHLQSVYSLSTYEGYSTTCSPIVFLSRFLPGNTASIAYFSSNGMDIYFGMFFLIGVFLFFAMRIISGTKRKYYGFFTIIVIASLWISPVRYVFNLLSDIGNFSLSYSFFLIFWCLKLAAEAFSMLNKAHTTDLHIGLLFTALLILISWIGSFHNFHTFIFPVIAIIFALFAILIYSNKLTGGTKKILPIFVLSLVCVEFFINAFFITNTNFIPSEKSLSTTYIWDTLQIGKKSDAGSSAVSETVSSTSSAEENSSESIALQAASQQLINQEAYNEFSDSHTNKTINNLLNTLNSTVSLETSEAKKYCGKELPNGIETLNALCHKIGLEEDLFTPYEVSFSLENSDYYSFISLGNNIYCLDLTAIKSDELYFYVPFTIQTQEALPQNLYMYNNSTAELLQLTSDNQQNYISGYMILANLLNSNINFQLTTYVLNENAADKLPVLLEDYAEQSSADNSSLNTVVYAGVILSCIGLLIFLSLYFNSDKEKVYCFLLSVKEKLDNWIIPKKIAVHLKENRIYYYAFFIPLLLYVGNMIITNCVPFGNDSFWDEDGAALTLPSYLDIYYSQMDNNTYLSMNGGYGSNIYANQPLVSLFSFFKLFSADQIAPLLLFGEALCLGFCGLFMVFYMTHRLHDTKVCKEDYCLLAPAMIYALNAYMLSMHNYTGWYFTLLALPLLMLAMDYLMYKGKTLPYVLLLTYCIITNLYLALYICIFLVIYFFTCHFKNVKDFLGKGIRFGFCSLLAAGNSFFIIANTLLSSLDSPYKITDSVFPSLGLHTSFLEQWKKHMIFTTARSVSADNGMLNIYCGILTLFLVILYFTAKNISLKTKLKKLIPILLLYISFNGQVLSFIWNGFHYQTKVPNRYAFLLLFLLAELSYEGLCQIRNVSVKKYTAITIGLAGFFLICQFFSEGNSSLSWIATLIICLVYLVLHLLYNKRKEPFYPKVLVCLLGIELAMNMTYAVKNFELGYINYLGNYASTADYINEELAADSDYFRISFPSSWPSNSGQIYHTGSNSLFNSFVTNHQGTLNGLYGFYSGGNIIRTNHASTPLGMSLSSTRYIFLPVFTTGTVEGFENYNYLGIWDFYYVFENPNALSIGIYAPTEAASLQSIEDAPQFFNDLISLYTKKEEDIFISDYIAYSDDETIPNTFYFTDEAGNRLSYDETDALYSEVCDTASLASIKDFRMHINYTPQHDGVAYLCAGELVPLARSKTGVSVQKDMYFPNKVTWFGDVYKYIILDENVLDDFFTEARKNQLENITIGNDTITGTTNYEEAGYTMLSLACDRSWHAYIDGEEVEIEDPYDSFMMIKTPAGKHTLELKYVPYGMKVSKGITLGFWLLTIVIYLVIYLIKRHKKLSQS